MNTNAINIGAAQLQRCVYGLRIRPEDEPCSIRRCSTLAAMDAPSLLPAGSMESADFPGTDFTPTLRLIMETNVIRGASPATVFDPTFKEIT